MRGVFRSSGLCLGATLAVLSGAAVAAEDLITSPVSAGALTTLRGNTRPEALRPENDRGAVPDSLPMGQMLLQLRRSAASEKALAAFIEEQQDPKSPNFHHWLTTEELAARYGASNADIAKISDWLKAQGFTVEGATADKMVIAFSGTAGAVRAAFHTDIHYVLARGVVNFANTSDPQIPTALAPAVVGVVSLNNIKPLKNVVPKTQFTTSSGNHLVAPGDLATIYNFNPVFAGGNTGAGQSIYLIEDTDLYSNADWTKFRSTFGLSG